MKESWTDPAIDVENGRLVFDEKVVTQASYVVVHAGMNEYGATVHQEIKKKAVSNPDYEGDLVFHKVGYHMMGLPLQK